MAKKQILTNDNIEIDIKNILKRPANLSHIEYRKSMIPLLVHSVLTIIAMLVFENHYKWVLFVSLMFIVVYLAIGYFYQKNRTKNLSIDDYEIKNEVISHIKEETYTIRKRNAIDKTMCVYIMYFENGKSWNIPKDNYLWSGECPMSDRTLYQTTHRGDIFWVVTKKDTCEIVVAYPTEYFEYKN